MYVPPPSELLPNRFVPLRSMDSSSKGFKPKLVSRLQQIELRVLPLGQGVEIFAFNVPLAPGSPMAAQGRVGRKRGVRRRTSAGRLARIPRCTKARWYDAMRRR
jgi:hypothetical protein